MELASNGQSKSILIKSDKGGFAVSQGVDNLGKIIESCRLIDQQMREMKEWDISSQLEALKQWDKQLQGLRDKFFMKTVAAVPATRKCLEGVEKVHSILNDCKDQPESHTLANLKKALGFLSEAIEELMNKAEMGGITLT